MLWASAFTACGVTERGILVHGHSDVPQYAWHQRTVTLYLPGKVRYDTWQGRQLPRATVSRTSVSALTLSQVAAAFSTQGSQVHEYKWQRYLLHTNDTFDHIDTAKIKVIASFSPSESREQFVRCRYLKETQPFLIAPI